MFRYPLLVLAVCLASLPAVNAADQKAPSAADEFASMYTEWKGLLAKFAQIRARYQTDASADKKALDAEA